LLVELSEDNSVIDSQLNDRDTATNANDAIRLSDTKSNVTGSVADSKVNGSQPHLGEGDWKFNSNNISSSSSPYKLKENGASNTHNGVTPHQNGEKRWVDL